jgi:hypothetical protein
MHKTYKQSREIRSASEGFVELPTSSWQANLDLVNGCYRTPKTNNSLEILGFTAVNQRDNLFIAYGKETVLRALALYTASDGNAHRDESNLVPVETAQAGLVSLMEGIRVSKRRSGDAFVDDFMAGKDITETIRRKYEMGMPQIKFGSEAELDRLIAIHEVLGSYVLGASQKKES